MLMLFRREVVEGMRRLQEGEKWTALVDYTIIAWGYVQVPIQPGISFMYSIVKATVDVHILLSFCLCTFILYTTLKKMIL